MHERDHADQAPHGHVLSHTTTTASGSTKTDAIGEVVSNIWLWIAATLALGAYFVFFTQLPPWVQFWFDPKTLFLAVIFAAIAVLGIYKQARKFFSQSSRNHEATPHEKPIEREGKPS
jgi:hypothetical protein